MYIVEALCAMAIASLCTDVEASLWIQKADASGDCTFARRWYKYPEKKLFVVKCGGSKCTIRDILVNGVQDGDFLLSAESATTNICSNQSRRCLATIQIDETQFFIEVKPNPSFSKGILTVQLDQKGTIYELRHEGAWFKIPNTVVINSGYLPFKFPQYKITCNGNCRIQNVIEKGDNFKIAISKKPALVRKGGCHNCLCVSSKVCSGLNLQSDSFYVSFVPDPEVKDVQAHVKLSNFKAVTKINHDDMIKNMKTDDKGNPAEVYVVNGPIQSDLTLEFKVAYNYYYSESRLHVDVITNGTVKAVLAARPDDDNIQMFNGGCTNCRCTSRKSCESFINRPDRAIKYTIEIFRLRVVLGQSSSLIPTYVRVSGQRFRKLNLVSTTG